jgi:hypothetical protein
MDYFARPWYELECVHFSPSVHSFVGQEMYGSRIETFSVLHGPPEPTSQDLDFAAYLREIPF